MDLTGVLVFTLMIFQGVRHCNSLTYRTYWFCEDSGAHALKCSGAQEQFINVTNAMYGRLRTDICDSGSRVTNCQSPLSTQVVARQCHGLNLCTIEATNAFFGDPCVTVRKYLEVTFSCLHGDSYPEIEKLQDGYVYSNQVPNRAILHMYSKSSDLAVGPYYFTIYKITEIASNAQYNKTIYQDALNFLQTQIKSPTIAQGAVCKPNLNDPASKFCVHSDLGYIFTSATFIPGMYPGKAYELGIVVRDHSSVVPVVRKTTQRISVVPACFPMTELYKSVKTSCPHDAQKAAFPPGYSWSNAYYTKILMRVVPPMIIGRVYFDTNLLADFKRDSSYWTYNITLTISGVKHKRAFTYIPTNLDKLFYHDKPTASGFKFNVTIEHPIEVATANNVYVELKLINSGSTTAVKYNSPNAVYLYGTKKLTTCPGTACMASYKTWVDGIVMLKTSQNSDCVEDHFMQEIYLKPCDSETCNRKVDVPISTPADTIIYHFQNEGVFTDLQPTYYRVVKFEYDGESFSGYSDKYFCNPAPFDGARRFICLNRYKGRLRIRKSSAADFIYLAQWTHFNITIQAEGTINGTMHFKLCTVKIFLTAPVTTTAQPSTTNSSLTTSSTPSTVTQIITTTTTPTKTTTTTTKATTTTSPTLPPTTTKATTTSSPTLPPTTTKATTTTSPTLPPTTTKATTTSSPTLPPTTTKATTTTSPTLPPTTTKATTTTSPTLPPTTTKATTTSSPTLPPTTTKATTTTSPTLPPTTKATTTTSPTLPPTTTKATTTSSPTLPPTTTKATTTTSPTLPPTTKATTTTSPTLPPTTTKATTTTSPTLPPTTTKATTTASPTLPPTTTKAATTTTEKFEIPPPDESLKVIVPKTVLFSKSFNLTCERSTGFDSLITWFKDDMLLTTTGQKLAIDGKDYASQGYYKCETRIGDVMFSSEKALVVYEDVSTTTVYLQIINEAFSLDLENRNSVAFQLLSSDIINAVKKVLLGLSSKGQHYVEIEKFTKGSVVAQVIIASQRESGVEMGAYYNQMTKLLSDAAAQNTFGRFQIPSTSIVIASKEYCIQETSNVQSSKGPYNWPMTKTGQNATVACPNGPAGSNATRACKGSYVNGARWGDVADSLCAFNNKISEELNQLSEVTINDTNAESTATALEKLTKNATSFTADDTVFAATTFVKLISVNVTTDKIVNDILETASNLLQANESALATSQAQGKALSSIVQGIETLADKIPLPNTTGTPVVRVSSGVAIQALKIDKSSNTPLKFGMKNASFSLNNVVSNQAYDSSQVQVGLSLPETLALDIIGTDEPRISFIAYKGSQFFQTTKTDFRGRRNVDKTQNPNSMVISAHVKGSKRVNLSKNLTGTFKKISPSQADKCVFWDFAKNDGFGAWSSEGCRQNEVSSGRVICECDHMTNFAILFDVYAGRKTVEDETHEQILGIISFIGIGLSLGGLFLVLLTMAMFSRLRRNLPSKILIHLCLALMLTLICFVAGADRTEPVYVCRGFAVAIQYFLLASFCWMSVESVNLYLSFVVVMGSYITKFMLKAAVFAWGLPAVIVAVTASLRIQDYGNERYCVVSGWAAYGTMFAPICLIVILNIGVFIRVFYALQSSAKGKKISKDQKRTGISQLRIAATFSCILGLTWIFGIFAIADARIFFQYLFCIFNSLQGFIIFYLHVARQQEARKHWIFFLTGKGLNYHRATMSSSTARTMRTNKGETYRLRTPSADKNGTLTSTLGRSNEYSNNNFRPSQSEA